MDVWTAQSSDVCNVVVNAFECAWQVDSINYNHRVCALVEVFLDIAVLFLAGSIPNVELDLVRLSVFASVRYINCLELIFYACSGLRCILVVETVVDVLEDDGRFAHRGVANKKNTSFWDVIYVFRRCLYILVFRISATHFLFIN